MSDYVDTVDIEGIQYDIQDSATKNALANFEGGFVLSSEKVDTGQKWFGNKTIYSQLLALSATNYVDSVDRRTFELQLPNNIHRILTMSGTYSVYSASGELVTGQSLPALWVGSELKAFLWINAWFGIDNIQHLAIAGQKAPDYRRATAELLIKYIEA